MSDEQILEWLESDVDCMNMEEDDCDDIIETLGGMEDEILHLRRIVLAA